MTGSPSWVQRARTAPYRADYQRMTRMSRPERAQYAANAVNAADALCWCELIRGVESRAAGYGVKPRPGTPRRYRRVYGSRRSATPALPRRVADIGGL